MPQVPEDYLCISQTCPVCGKKVLAYKTYVGWAHDFSCWWTEGKERNPKLSLWERIKKHGLKARIF